MRNYDFEVTRVVVSERCAGTSKAFFEATGENRFGMTRWLLRVDSAEEVDAYLRLRGEADFVQCAACTQQVYNYFPNGLCEACQPSVG